MKKTKSIACTLILNKRYKIDKITKDNIQGFSNEHAYFVYKGKLHKYNLDNFVNISIVDSIEPKNRNTFELESCSYFDSDNSYKYIFKNTKEKLEITFDKNDFSNKVWEMLKIGNKYKINISEETPFDYEKFEKELEERKTN